MRRSSMTSLATGAAGRLATPHGDVSIARLGWLAERGSAPSTPCRTRCRSCSRTCCAAREHATSPTRSRGARGLAWTRAGHRVHAGTRVDAGLHRGAGGRRPRGDAERRGARRAATPSASTPSCRSTLSSTIPCRSTVPDAGGVRGEHRVRVRAQRRTLPLLRWAQQAFDGVRVVPPGAGICHQVNLEHLGGW